MRKDWKFESRPEPGKHGQRFFTRVDSGSGCTYTCDSKLYVCDNSGPNPGRAEDGPLYVDPSRKIRVGVWGEGKGVDVSVPVICESSGGQYWCGLTPGELLWLIDSGWAERTGVGVEFAPGLNTLRKLFLALQDVPMPEIAATKMPPGYDPSLDEE